MSIHRNRYRYLRFECDATGCKEKTGYLAMFHDAAKPHAERKGWEIGETHDYCPKHKGRH